MAKLGITGQRGISHAAKVLPVLMPSVLESDLLDPAHWVNQRELSGKQEGSCVIVRRTSGMELAIATGDTQTAPWDMYSEPDIPGATKAGVDVYNWTGSEVIATGAYFNLLGLSGITTGIDGGVSEVDAGIMKLPPVADQTLVQITVRLTGTTATNDPLDWRVQTRRPDDTTVLSSVSGARMAPQLNINNREAFLSSYTNGEADPFSTEGFSIGIHVPAAFQDITITGMTIRVGRIPK